MRHLLVGALLGVLTGCDSADLPAAPYGADRGVYLGEVVFVAVYPSVDHYDRLHTTELATTLSVHNTDLVREIALTKVDFLNTQGQPLRRYVATPVHLHPLETMHFAVAAADTVEGPGASFVVEWTADGPVSSPAIEAVMVNASGTMALVTDGRIIRRCGWSQHGRL